MVINGTGELAERDPDEHIKNWIKKIVMRRVYRQLKYSCMGNKLSAMHDAERIHNTITEINALYPNLTGEKMADIFESLWEE